MATTGRRIRAVAREVSRLLLTGPPRPPVHGGAWFLSPEIATMQTPPDLPGPDAPREVPEPPPEPTPEPEPTPGLPPAEVPAPDAPRELPTPDDPDPVQPPAHDPVPPAPRA